MNRNVGRIVAVAFAIFLSFCALLFGLFYAGIYSSEPGVQHRHLNVVIGFFPYLFTFCLVYRFSCTDELESCEILYLWDFHPKAFLRRYFSRTLCLRDGGRFGRFNGLERGTNVSCSAASGGDPAAGNAELSDGIYSPPLLLPVPACGFSAPQIRDP